MKKTGWLILLCLPLTSLCQLDWTNVDSLFPGLPNSIHVFRTYSSLDGKPNIAYYVAADLNDRNLRFDADTSQGRRLTPQQFFEKNGMPEVVVNCTFFSFQTNQNLNAVVKENKLVSYNVHSIPGRGRDSGMFRHPLGSAIGISKKRKADVAWLLTDSTKRKPYAVQFPMAPIKNNTRSLTYDSVRYYAAIAGLRKSKASIRKWKMLTAVGGGPVLVQDGKISISNNEEMKFAGKAIDDKHPRTAMGYTGDGRLIILVVQGRAPGAAEGASLRQLADMLQSLGCREALNLDGGGSSCLLVNGKETIKPSDAGGQRAVPAAFIIKSE